MLCWSVVKIGLDMKKLFLLLCSLLCVEIGCFAGVYEDAYNALRNRAEFRSMDDELNQRYKRLMSSLPREVSQRLKRDQVEWLKQGAKEVRDPAKAQGLIQARTQARSQELALMEMILGSPERYFVGRWKVDFGNAERIQGTKVYELKPGGQLAGGGEWGGTWSFSLAQFTLSFGRSEYRVTPQSDGRMVLDEIEWNLGRDARGDKVAVEMYGKKGIVAERLR